ncbi:Olfactory receptor 2L3 [Dissostichus eleginoides]|uniref:Olfactory receptor 2L3 n=1 Tax=Dissostichus eleginoides TaxID=100907 RepID=A0AAD9CJB8_DISEL|nr:Olfactory receptor 2L3 [Dissostichus eleginoides]
MTSAGFNVTSSLTLVGFSSLSGHSSLLFFVFLLLYLFVLFSDSLGFFVSSLGGASFMLLSAMAFDRYLSICYPMHYAVLDPFICLRRSRSFSSKALQTCLPHLLVFFNYSISVYLDMMLRRLQSNRESDSTVITSILIVPTVLNPVVYGLKLKEVFTHVKRLLSCRRDS